MPRTTRAIQGETGAPSTSDTFGALRHRPWSEVTQAKWNLRRMLAHYARDIPFNLFTLMELRYPTGWNTKGLLRSDDEGRVVRPKPAYFAAQRVVTLFDGSVDRLADCPVRIEGAARPRVVAARHRTAGRDLVALWLGDAPPGEVDRPRPVGLTLPAAEFDEPVWVDLRTGDVRSIPSDCAERLERGWRFRDLPVGDSPVLIADCAVVPIDPTVRPGAAAMDAHRARWNNPEVRRRIEEGIRRHRQRTITLRALGPDGRPLAGAIVEVRQTSHEFLFGCNAFVLGQLPTPELSRRYESAFLRLFNFAAVPFYWKGTEPERGRTRYEDPAPDIWRRPPPGRFLPWAATNGLTLKGHPLLWHAYNPPWLPADAAELRALFLRRFDEISERLASRIPIWDVVNESLICPTNWPLYTADLEYVAWAFGEVGRRWPPDALLMINEVTELNFEPADRNRYLAQVRCLRKRGLPVRGVGLQFHFFRRKALDAHLVGPHNDPAALLDLYEAFGRQRLPLFITEITFPSAGDDGDSVQAEVVEDHYRLWFSSPAMRGITWWNLGDGTAVPRENEALGGLVDDRFHPKAAYRVLERLIRDEWTTVATLTTDTDGRAPLYDFHGRYRARASVGGVRLDAEFDLRGPPASEDLIGLRFSPLPAGGQGGGEREPSP